MLILLWLACAHAAPKAPANAVPLILAPSPDRELRPFPGGVTPVPAVRSTLVSEPMDAALGRLLDGARHSGFAYLRLGILCDRYSRRFAGTEALVNAATWAANTWKGDVPTVRLEPVNVRHWVRGPESLTMTAPERRELNVIGLGGTISGTVEAPVVVVRSFDELGPHVAGKIVLYNVVMPLGVPAGERYGDTVPYRSVGAARAARFGAVASLTRSVTQRSLYTVHTGAMHYEDDAGPSPKIPSAAITGEDADWIMRLTQAGTEVKVALDLQSQELAPVPSWNVVAEIPGKTSEVVLIAAHLDSWDVGQGAHDDGAGVVHVMEAMRLIQAEVSKTGVAPLRTIRGVLYANEEFGLDGAHAYDIAHGSEPHIAAMETDLGGGVPLSWQSTGTPAQIAWLRTTLAPLGMPVEEGGGGADISPLEPRGVVVTGLHPDDTHYFDFHHTDADTYDKIDPVALAEGAAAVTGWAWLVANAPGMTP